MRVRYEGPEQGIALLHHSLDQYGVNVTSTTPPPDDLAPMDHMVCVELEVAGDAEAHQLARAVRAALEDFATMYHRAGIDLIDAAAGTT